MCTERYPAKSWECNFSVIRPGSRDGLKDALICSMEAFGKCNQYFSYIIIVGGIIAELIELMSDP